MKCKQRKEERSKPTSAEEEQCSRSEEPELCEASEKGSQDQTHSTADLNVKPQLDERRLKVKWPPMADKKEWAAMDEDISASISCQRFISTKQKLRWLMTTIYQYGSEKFGVTEKKVQPREARGQSRHQKEIKGIRKELRALTKRWKAVNKNGDKLEIMGINELRDQCRQRLKKLRKAEHLKRRKLRERQRMQFFDDPFKFIKGLFDSAKSGTLNVRREDLEEHLKSTYLDSLHEEELGSMLGLINPTKPVVPFNLSEPKLSEVEKYLKKAGTASSPGPNGVPYVVFKKCSGIRHALWEMLKVLWRNDVVSDSWSKAEGVYIPKEENSVGISMFCPISLLDMDGKIMFGILANRLAAFLLQNGYINTSVQKAGIAGFPGCVEHCAMIWHTIQEAKVNNDNLSVVWLDLAIAYGSVPHKLTEFSLDFFHVPRKLKSFLMDYYASFQMRFSAGDYLTQWQKLEVGIPMGCTISPILFAMAMEVLVQSARSWKPDVTINPCIHG